MFLMHILMFFVGSKRFGSLLSAFILQMKSKFELCMQFNYFLFSSFYSTLVHVPLMDAFHTFSEADTAEKEYKNPFLVH